MQMRLWSVIVAAGSGTRMGSALPKVLLPLLGRPALEWAAEAFFRCPRVEGMVIVAGEAVLEPARNLAGAAPIPVRVTLGGGDRAASVRKGLACLPDDCTHVLIHDGARPCITPEDVTAVIDALGDCAAAIPGQPMRDAAHLYSGPAEERILGSLDKENVWMTQTPQGFERERLLAAIAGAEGAGEGISDDAGLFARVLGAPVKRVRARIDNIKLTTPEDVELAEAILAYRSRGPRVRTGIGFDAHRLAEGRRLVLGGVSIDHPLGLDGHSDADVAVHALMDAMLGAAALGDIGRHFPPGDARFKDISSVTLLLETDRILRQAGYRVSCCDITITAQRPRLAPHIPDMRRNIARALGLEQSRVSVKATTTEGMGFEGRGEGISALASVTVEGP